MKLNLINSKDILDFEKEINHELVVNERKYHTKRILKRYYAKFEDSEISEGGFLMGSYGDEDTIDEAISNYCKEISGKIIVFNAYSPQRNEIIVPKLIHTKLLNQ